VNVASHALQWRASRVDSGVNEMLDAILLPSAKATAFWRNSSGKIDELITATYKGDHEKMKVAVNMSRWLPRP